LDTRVDRDLFLNGMNRIFRIFNREFNNVNQAALLLGLTSLLSQILALFRDRFLAHYVGPSTSLDVYYAAFRIPDFIFISVASLASVMVLIPFMMTKMKENEITENAKKFMNDVFTVFFGVLFLVSLLAFILMPFLVNIITPGFDQGLQNKVIELSRIMLLSPILMGLSNLFGTVTQIFRKFFFFSLSPVLYNLAIIIGVIFLYPLWGLKGLALGVVFGAFLHFLIQIIGSFNSGFKPRFSFRIDFTEIKKVVLISLPRTLGIAFNNIALIFIISQASSLTIGSISVFNLSLNLQSVPLNIFGLSYAVASFPVLAKAFSMNRLDQFKNQLKATAQQIIFWSIPVTFLFIVLRAQIVRVILGSSSFSWENTRLVAASLAIFSISVLAQGMVAFFSRAYYATGNTKKPLLINFISSVCIVIFTYLFISLFKNFEFFRYFIEDMFKVSDIKGTEVLMLPLAYSFGTILNFILQWFFIKRDFMKNELFIAKSFFQSLGASFFIAFATYLGLKIFSPIFGLTTFWGVFLQGFLSGILGILVGIVVLYLLKNEEMKDILITLKSKFWKTKVISPPQQEL
jgi:putative peptidoglycan lipid II flippase